MKKQYSSNNINNNNFDYNLDNRKSSLERSNSPINKIIDQYYRNNNYLNNNNSNISNNKTSKSYLQKINNISSNNSKDTSLSNYLTILII